MQNTAVRQYGYGYRFFTPFPGAHPAALMGGGWVARSGNHRVILREEENAKLPLFLALQSQVLLVVGSSTQDSKDHAGSSRGASISMCMLSLSGESLIRQASFPRGPSLWSSPTISDPSTSKSCGRPSKVRSSQETGPRSLEGSRVVQSSQETGLEV